MSQSNLDSTARIAEMQTLLAKYTANFPARPARTTASESSGPSGTVVLVTGTTGSLGCHILETLARAPSVLRVYAVNRADRRGRGLRERQAEALRDKGIDEVLLDAGTGKIVLVKADLTKRHFGLPEVDYREMHGSVTHVLHNAWRVDYLSPLSTYEPNIAGLRALIDFCLTSSVPSAPRLIFTSTIIVLGRAPKDRPALEDPIPASIASGLGYVESKWVSEELIYAASRVTPLDGLVVRVGQLCGGKAGAWAKSEWFPRMVQSASKSEIGCLPDDDRLTDFVPFDLCADVLLDLIHAPCGVLARAAPTRTIHLLHPCPVPWHDIMQHIAHELGARLVSYAEWFNAVERAAANLIRSGGRQSKMLAVGMPPFLPDVDEKTLTGPRAGGFPVWDGRRGVAASPTLADPNLRQLGAEDVKRWVGYWKRIGFIQGESSPRPASFAKGARL